MDLSIIPECYVDTNLTESITTPTTGYNHQKGCGTVARLMQNKLSDSFAVGIIDKDKKDIDYLKQFTEIARKGNLILHKHPDKHHYFIQISPAVERFILDCAQTAGIVLSDYDLPIGLEELKKESKSVNSKKDQRFKKLFAEFKKKKVPQIELLASWIEYLKNNNYKADQKTLVSL